MRSLTATLILLTVLVSAPASAWADDEPGGPKYPEYVVGGVISLAAAGGFAIGGTVATFDDSPQTAIGLLGLGTVAAGVGVPLLLLGAADETPVSTERTAAGVALATPGVIGLGLGGIMWAAQAASEDDKELALPVALVIGGGVATVVGLIVYATGASHDDSADKDSADKSSTALNVEVAVGPTGVSIAGTF